MTICLLVSLSRSILSVPIGEADQAVAQPCSTVEIAQRLNVTVNMELEDFPSGMVISRAGCLVQVVGFVNYELHVLLDPGPATLPSQPVSILNISALVSTYQYFNYTLWPIIFFSH